MSDTTMSANSAEDIQPIKLGLFQAISFIYKNYTNPLQHAQELNVRYMAMLLW